MIFVIISFLVIAVYIAAVCIKQKGFPYSISATFYAIEHKWWFSFTMWATPILLMPTILEISKPGTECLAFFSLIGMIMVGCFPNYRSEKFQYRGHITGATMAIVFSQLWVVLNFCPILAIWGLYIGYTVLKMVKEDTGTFQDKFMETKPMFWLEIFSFEVVYASCIMLKL